MTIEVPATLHVWSQPQQERALHGIGSSQRTSESQLSERHLGKLFQSLSVGVVYRLCSGNFLECCLELELADGCRSISYHAALPCTFMMLMCMKGHSGCDLRRAGGAQQDH